MEKAIELFEIYLLTEKRVSPNTHSAYCSDIGQLIAFVHDRSAQPITCIRYEQVKEYLSFLKEKKLTAKSICRKISTFKIFLQWAHQRLGWPAIQGKWITPKIEKNLPLFLNKREIESLLKATDHDTSLSGCRNKMIVYLLYATGMRISELTSLRLENVQSDTGLIQVAGKGGKSRLIPLPYEIISHLQTYIQNVRAALISHMKHDPGYLFPVVYGKKIKPISRQAVWILIRTLCTIAGIQKKVSPHIIRHSLATHLLNQGAHLRSLQILLGHEKLATVELYTHLKTDEIRKIYDKKHPRA